MTQLAGIGVPMHLLSVRLNMREQLIKEVEIIPLEAAVRNVASGSMSRRLGIEEGTRPCPCSIIEHGHKNDSLNDPQGRGIHHRLSVGPAPQDLDDMVNLTNPGQRLPFRAFSSSAGDQADRFQAGISTGCGKTTSCASSWPTRSAPTIRRLWDTTTNEKLDKDRFRRDLGGVVEAYSEVARRLGIMPESVQGENKGPVLVK